MCSAGWQLHHLHSFQLNLFRVNIFKWPESAAEEHWHDVNVQLIDKSCSEALLCGACSTYHCNIFIARSRFGLSNECNAKVSVGSERELPGGVKTSAVEFTQCG